MPRDEDLDDDALEREQQNPMMAGGPKHAPKLGTESRAINLRDVRDEFELPSERRREERAAAEAQSEEPPPPPRQKQQLPAIPSRELKTNVRQLAGRLGLPAPPSSTPFRSPAPASDDSAAWDRAFDAALPLVIGLATTYEEAAELAAQFADLKLEQRRRRFG